MPSSVVPPPVTSPRPRALGALRRWTPRRWAVAGVAGVMVFLAIGLPTDVVPNPVFGRPVEVTWWSPWVLVASSILGGLVAATYVRGAGRTSLTGGAGPGAPDSSDAALDPPGRLAGLGGLLGFFAVGCPVCNKLVVVALGTTGALQWFAPLQPLLAVASVIALAVALRGRLRGEVACALPGRPDA